MGRRKGWFSFGRRLFVSESKVKPDEKSKTCKWFFRKFRFWRYPVLEMPQMVEEQRKRALAVAVATVAAAEAAVAAANAAAEVVRLTNIPCIHERKSWGHAAVVIQCAYRSHLARKALSALRGVVKLQAVVRGELVRRRVVEALPMKCFLSNARLQVQRRMVPPLYDYLNRSDEKINCVNRSKFEELRPHGSTSWDLSSISKEEMEALYRQKQEAIAKRDRMKQYSSSQRERRSDQSQEPAILRGTRRGDQHYDKEKLKPLCHDKNQLSLPRIKCQSEWVADNFKTRFSQARRSFVDARSLPSSPIVPTYMATTKSAKAKLRSLSTPSQRLRLYDTYSGDQHSPFKLKLDSCSSFNGDNQE